MSAAALGDGALLPRALCDQYLCPSSLLSSAWFCAAWAAWAGASPREAPPAKSTSAAKWIAQTILVLMRLCKPGCGSQSLTSLVAHSVPITSCSPGAFVPWGYCNQTRMILLCLFPCQIKLVPLFCPVNGFGSVAFFLPFFLNLFFFLPSVIYGMNLNIHFFD